MRYLISSVVAPVLVAVSFWLPYILEPDRYLKLVPVLAWLALACLFREQIARLLSARAAVWQGIARALKNGGPFSLEVSGGRVKLERKARPTAETEGDGKTEGLAETDFEGP